MVHLQFNESVLNVTDTIIMNPETTRLFVTIDSCKAYAAQAIFWQVVYGCLFLISFSAFCYMLYKYRKSR